MVSPLHAGGTVYTYPVASTSAMFLTLRSNFPGSNGQKQSVSDAFQNVVLPPYSRSTFFKVARRELANAKILLFI